MNKRRDNAIFWGVIGVIILAEASTALGKAVGYWEADFPFWASILVWIGFAIVYASVRKIISVEDRAPNTSVSTNNYPRRWIKRWDTWDNRFRRVCELDIKENKNNEPCC
jgi:predicted tellurium resistance membrane protein TerC